MDTITTSQAVTVVEEIVNLEELEKTRAVLQAERVHFAHAAFAFADHTAQVEQMAEDCYRALAMLLTRLYEHKRKALYLEPVDYQKAQAVLAKYKVQQPTAESDKTPDEITHGWEDEAYD